MKYTRGGQTQITVLLVAFPNHLVSRNVPLLGVFQFYLTQDLLHFV